jgi:hypothetical protein
LPLGGQAPDNNGIYFTLIRNITDNYLLDSITYQREVHVLRCGMAVRRRFDAGELETKNKDLVPPPPGDPTHYPPPKLSPHWTKVRAFFIEHLGFASILEPYSASLLLQFSTNN